MKSISIVLVCFAALAFGSATAKPANSTINGEIFRADFSKSSLSAAFGGVGVSYGTQNVILWASGDGIDVVYPAGSYKPSASPQGGFGLFTSHKVSNTAVFKYEVKFPAGYNFVKGGKLPGLYGGKRSCTGGDPATDCFSTRLMWREDGKGELYLYANRDAQDQTICSTPPNYCNPEFGWSLNKGAFTFQRDAWTQVEQRVTLNTPGVRNGIISIKINGKEVIRYNNIVFRIAQYPNMQIDGIDVETFFGGGSPDWATPTRQITKFRNFILSSE